jgi:hypothetical protein
MSARGGAVLPEEAPVAVALGRAAAYRLLGGAWAYPAPAHLEELAHLAESAATDPDLAPAFAAFAAAARHADAQAVAQSTSSSSIARRCPPYERLGQRAEWPSRRLAGVAGYRLRDRAERGPPHGGSHRLKVRVRERARAQEAWALRGQGRRGGHHAACPVSFLADHLGRWAEAFALAVKAATPLPYYAALADRRLGSAPTRACSASRPTG